ncbi:MAG: tetratricopeptide repeat protein [Myxococcota bacterium]
MADESPNTRSVALEDTGWARLLFALLSQRFSGRIQLEQDGETRTVVFHGGFPILADYAVEGTGVSQILCSAGVLDDAAAEAMREAAPDDGLDAYQHAISTSLVDDDTAGMALRDQCEQRVGAIGGLTRGTLTLLDDTGIPEETAATLSAARVLRVINRSVREFCSPQRAEEALGHFEDRPLRITPSFAKYRDRFGFDQTDNASITTLVEYGDFCLEDLANFSMLDPVRGLQLLYTLYACNMLREAEEASAEVSAVTDLREQMAAADGGQGRSEISLVIELLGSKIQSGAQPFDILAISADASLEEIDAAYEDLCEKVRRGEAAALEGSLRDVRDAARARRGVTARAAAKKALKDRSYKRARSALRDLVTLDDGDVDARVDLAWVSWETSPKHAGAEGDLEAALNDAGDEHAKALFYLGQLRKHQGKTAGALEAFDTAASLDPKLIDAQREARALRSGTRAGKDSSAKTSRSDGAAFKPKSKKSGPASKYWSGPWPTIWILSGILLGGMLIAQIVLRLDADF